jgi:hypothetical protein
MRNPIQTVKKTATALCLLGAVALTTAPLNTQAQVNVTVDPGASWLGYMNVFDLPSAGGAFRFGSPWGTGDLAASFSGPVLTLAPNTIGDPDPYWYIGGGGPGAPGNKIMEANMYVQNDGGWAGQTVSFSGTVLANTFTSAHTTIAFIKDFAPDFSSFVQTTVALGGPGDFNISLATINDPARHVQYGFQTVGVNVWVTDVAPYGNLQVTAVPEPSTFALAGLGLSALLILRRRR